MPVSAPANHRNGTPDTFQFTKKGASTEKNKRGSGGSRDSLAICPRKGLTARRLSLSHPQPLSSLSRHPWFCLRLGLASISSLLACLLDSFIPTSGWLAIYICCWFHSLVVDSRCGLREAPRAARGAPRRSWSYGSGCNAATALQPLPVVPVPESRAFGLKGGNKPRLRHKAAVMDKGHRRGRHPARPQP
jgi:hypothetical protein